MVWEEKMSISKVSEFSILPYTWNRKLENLGKFSLTSNLISNECPRQINKDTVYKKAPINACFFLNDVNSFLRSFSRKAGALV